VTGFDVVRAYIAASPTGIHDYEQTYLLTEQNQWTCQCQGTPTIRANPFHRERY